MDPVSDANEYLQFFDNDTRSSDEGSRGAIAVDVNRKSPSCNEVKCAAFAQVDMPKVKRQRAELNDTDPLLCIQPSCQSSSVVSEIPTGYDS